MQRPALPREVKLTLTGVFIGLFLAALDQTVVATALPRMLQELGGQAWYGWIGALYLLGSTLAAPIAGRLVEIVPRKPVLLGALGLFGIGSLLCGLAEDFRALLAFRFVQGIGGGALFSLAFTTLAWFFSPRERSRWAGLVGALFGIASAIGPPLGGYLAQSLSWRWAFWLNVPLLFVSMLFVWRFLPVQAPPDKGRLDVRGTLLLIGWVTPLLLAFSFWGPKSLGAPAWGLVLAAIGLLFLGAWIRVELREKSPLFDLALVRVRTFRQAAIAGFFFGPIFLGGVTFLPLYLQSVLGYTPAQSGGILLAFTIGMVMSTGATGAWVSRHGRYKPVLLGAAAIILLFFAGAALVLPPQLGVGSLLGIMGVGSVFFGPFQALLSVVGQNDAPIARVGSVTSALQFLRQVGSTLGLAALNSLYLLGGQGQNLLLGLRWVFGGSALLAAALLVSVWALPDTRLRSTRTPQEV